MMAAHVGDHRVEDDEAAVVDEGPQTVLRAVHRGGVGL